MALKAFSNLNNSMIVFIWGVDEDIQMDFLSLTIPSLPLTDYSQHTTNKTYSLRVLALCLSALSNTDKSQRKNREKNKGYNESSFW